MYIFSMHFIIIVTLALINQFSFQLKNEIKKKSPCIGKIRKKSIFILQIRLR